MRYCYYVSEAARLPNGKLAVLKVTQNQPGCEVTDIPAGSTLKEAEETVAEANERIGVTPKEALAIVASSMKAQNQRRKR